MLSTNKVADPVSSINREGLVLDLGQLTVSDTKPGVEIQQVQHADPPSIPPQATQQQQLGSGYIPSSVYSTRTQYRDQTYPTFAHSPHSTPRFAHTLPSNTGGSESASVLSLSFGSSTGTISSVMSGTGIALSPASVSSAVATSSRTPVMSRGAVPPPPPQRCFSPQVSSPVGVSPAGGTGERRRVAANNLYNTVMARTFCYDSGDELKTPSPVPPPVGSPYSAGFPSSAAGKFNFSPMASRSLAGSGQDLRGNMRSLVGSLEVMPGSEAEVREGSCSPRLGGGGVEEGGEARVQRYETHVEISKSFSMADAYRYSERRRRQGGVALTAAAGGTLDV